MKIVVIGGSGLGPSAFGVDTITGQGLAEAPPGAQVVVDVANPPSFEDQDLLRPNTVYSRIGRYLP